MAENPTWSIVNEKMPRGKKAMGKYPRLVALALVSFSLLMLSGCQSKNSKQDEVTKITFWHGINPPENREIFTDLLEKFHQLVFYHLEMRSLTLLAVRDRKSAKSEIMIG